MLVFEPFLKLPSDRNPGGSSRVQARTYLEFILVVDLLLVGPQLLGQVEGVGHVFRRHEVIDDLNTAVEVLDLETGGDVTHGLRDPSGLGVDRRGARFTHLVHGACRKKNRVSQELDHAPALDPVLIQQPLALLPAQVPAVLPDRVLVRRHVQPLLLTELEGEGGVSAERT